MYISDEKSCMFQCLLFDWYDKNKREFPWRYTFNPYKILVSEILLQQTNVKKIIDPYLKIIDTYKNINELSQCDIDFLKNIFKDIGLFYRADRLKGIAQNIVKDYNGIVPDSWDELIKISGIGDYICNAVLCFGFKKPYAVLDTNVIRIFDRLFDVKSDKRRSRNDAELLEFAQIILPEDRYVDYNYAILDFAACVCTRYNPKCCGCVFRFNCKHV